MIASAFTLRAVPRLLGALGLVFAVWAVAAGPAAASLPTAGGIYKGHVKGGKARLTVPANPRSITLDLFYKERCRFGDDRPFRSPTGVSVGARINALGDSGRVHNWTVHT